MPVMRGLVRGGALQILDAGVAATPTTGVLVRCREAIGGVQISASHNPAEYNGIKLFSAAGRVMPRAAGEQVVARFQHMNAGPAAYRDVSHEPLTDPTSEHLSLVGQIVDVERIRQRRYHVLLDANHASGSVLGRPLL